MILSKAFDVFAKQSPVCVMIRGTLENALPVDFVNELFENTARKQYTRELLFSDVLDVMESVVCQVFPSINAAYQKQQQRFSVSRRSLYGKINHLEPEVSRQLVVQAAQRLAPIVKSLRKQARLPELLPGYRVRILDGNHLAATEHRLKELRCIAAGPLPGQALVVLEPDLGLITDVFPCEDAHAQERSLLMEVLDTVRPDDLWMADRNFCTSLFLFETIVQRAFFVVRQHQANVRWEAVGDRQEKGRSETGLVAEQPVVIIDEVGHREPVRRITLKLDKPTQDGDREIHLLTNLPSKVKAARVTQLYRDRWRIEGAFGELATTLNTEVSSLGYPPAALFAFCTGLLAYNILSVMKSAIAATQGADRLDDISSYYLADELRGLMRGMLVAIPTKTWTRQFGDLSPRQMTSLLKQLGKEVNLAQFQKHRRGPKQPQPPRTRNKRQPHVATARLLAARVRK